MAQNLFKVKLFAVYLIFLMMCDVAVGVRKVEKERLKQEAKRMFYHAYRSYMENAYPADELMPLSCKGRYRDTEPNRGDIDDALGNFSLTLVDTLDTLLILGNLDEFERAAQLIIRDVSFDQDVVVSVFETNIRMLGGLLSGHILASYLKEKMHRLLWYRGELLNMAKDLGYRLLPAFNTTTGVPHPRINLRYGLKSPKLGNVRETCTACAGTMILELAALSRLSGEPIFEEKAHKAMNYLWQQRHRSSDLVGTVLNIHSGDWVRRDSGVGAGIDSYYEYCLKAYILLGYESYLERFNKHYSAVMKYVSQGPLLVDVHMHRPHTNSRNFMDSLLAFWPGLQVLKGDIKPAIETHEMLYQVLQRHTFLPEAFTMDFQVHWGQHPLRPEFLESTYFLYKATGDNYYLEVGKTVMNSLQKYAQVPCGFAAVKDVRTGTHEDRMDSFVLAETFKYLYLLFAEKEDLVLDLDDFVFTTEAHLLPLSLARMNNFTTFNDPNPEYGTMDMLDEEYDRSCPNNVNLFPGNKDFAHSIRQPLKNLVEGVCPKQRAVQRRLHAADFQPSNQDHIKLLRKMGITMMALTDGRVQLLQTAAHAETMEDAEEGVLFMQEMTELSRAQAQQTEKNPRVVYFTWKSGTDEEEMVVLSAGPAQFGLDLNGSVKVTGQAITVNPLRSCQDIVNAEAVRGKIAIVERGDCMFVDKARQLQQIGVIGGIVIDNTPDTSSQSLPMFAMSGDGKNDVTIPMVFLFSQDASILLKALKDDPNVQVTLAESVESSGSTTQPKAPDPQESLVPASPQGEAREVDVDSITTPSSETIYIHTKANGRVTLRRRINAGGTSTVVEVSEKSNSGGTSTVVEVNEKSLEGPADELDPKDENGDISLPENVGTLATRQREYLTTLQKLLETAMGDKQEIDPNTKQLLDHLSELMRPKPAPAADGDEVSSSMLSQSAVPEHISSVDSETAVEKTPEMSEPEEATLNDHRSEKQSSISEESRSQNTQHAHDDL